MSNSLSGYSSGNQSLSGVFSFSDGNGTIIESGDITTNNVYVNNSSITLINQLTTKDYVDKKVVNLIPKNNTWTGTNSFQNLVKILNGYSITFNGVGNVNYGKIFYNDTTNGLEISNNINSNPIRLITYNTSSQAVDVLDIYYNQVNISTHLIFNTINQGIKLQSVGGFIQYSDGTIQTTAFLGDSNYALLNATNTFTGDNNFNHGLKVEGKVSSLGQFYIKIIFSLCALGAQ